MLCKLAQNISTLLLICNTPLYSYYCKLVFVLVLVQAGAKHFICHAGRVTKSKDTDTHVTESHPGQKLNFYISIIVWEGVCVEINKSREGKIG